jgi:hypothetical protein
MATAARTAAVAEERSGTATALLLVDVGAGAAVGVSLKWGVMSAIAVKTDSTFMSVSLQAACTCCTCYVDASA